MHDKIIRMFQRSLSDDMAEYVLSLSEERKNDNFYLYKARDYFNIIKNNIDSIEPIHDLYNFKKFGYDINVSFYSADVPQKATYRHSENTISINVRNNLSIFYNGLLSDICKIYEQQIIHEIIHNIDFNKLSIQPDITQISKEPFNHPLEFNAYFQQVANYWHTKLPSIIAAPDPLGDFHKKIGNNAREFNDSFWNLLKRSGMESLITKDRRFKWSKRIYDLYFNLRNKAVEMVGGERLSKDIENDYK